VKRNVPRVSSTLVAFAVGLAACSVGKDEDRTRPESPATAAAAMRVTLDLLFREHVYLLGLTTENAVTGQKAAAKGTIEALEENTLALGDQFEVPYGDRGEKGFLSAWRPYTDLVALYAGRKARKLKLGNADKAFAQVSAKFVTFATLLTPLIGPRVMGSRMHDLIGTMRTVVDAQVAKDYVKADASLRTASDQAAAIASIFARTFADDQPARFAGDPLGASAELRASLSGRLADHVYLIGFTTENVLTGQSKPRDGAKAALDATSAAFAKVVGSAYGAEAEKAFLPVWKRQAELLLSYAGSIKDKTKHERVRQDLEKYATEASGFLVGLNRDINGSALERIIGEHGQLMTQAIDAQAAGNFEQADARLRTAARQTEALALALATATVARFPARFAPAPAGLPT
jgi:hypothetical protein